MRIDEYRVHSLGLLCAVAALCASAAHAQLIMTRVGGPVGDGGPALEAQLVPFDIAYDTHGNLFVAEQYRVRMITADGIIHTVAGTGEPPPTHGCGIGIALSTALLGVNNVAVDASDNVYVAVYENNCIMKIMPDGLVVPVAGTGAVGFSGDGGPALAAQIDVPNGLVLDGQGNLYFSDDYNHRVRKVDVNGVISTVAGTGAGAYGGDGGPAAQAALFLPHGLALDGAGNLFVADSGNSAVRKIDTAGTISTVAHGGFPIGVHIDRTGALLVADDFAVRRIDDAGNSTVLAGSLADFGFDGDGGPASAALLFVPQAVTLDAPGNVLVADVGNGRIRRIDAHGNIDTIAGGARYPDSTPATRAALSRPNKIAFDADGNLLIADAGNRRVRALRTDGRVATLAGRGGPRSGAPQEGAARDAAFADGISVVADAADGFYVGDGDALRHVDGKGTIRTLLHGEWSAPCTRQPVDVADPRARFGIWITAVTVDVHGDVLIADEQCNMIRRLHHNTLSTIAGDGGSGFAGDGGPAVRARLNQPTDVASDRFGNIFVADANNHRIRKIDPSGKIGTLAGTGMPGFAGDGGAAGAAQLNHPQGVMAGADGGIFIADTYNQVVRRIAPDGTISRVAGNYGWGFSGDGGDPARAQLRWPVALAMSSDGVLYVADQDNDRIRMVVFDDIFRAGFES